VLFGVGIAVNYLTILSGRHLLGSDTGDGALLSESMTTIALLLNTGLAIAISLVFRSRVLLGFAFIFAYLTPFLVDSTSSSIYLLVIYTTILTVAIAIINTLYTRLAVSESTEYLQGIGIVGMMILLSLATLDADSMGVIVICG
jgi:glucose-6-phosphate-specific signal transduction histidine kinase